MSNLENVKVFYNQGLRFFRCAERCMGDLNDDGSIQIIGGKYLPLSTPAMVNAAFSCEIFFKALLILFDIDYKKCLKRGELHKLKPLFDLLPEASGKEFLQVGNADEFQQNLTEHSADFETWRYYMENPGSYHISPDFTYMLAENLKVLTKFHIDKAIIDAEVQIHNHHRTEV